jgi:hypothetical protein
MRSNKPAARGSQDGIQKSFANETRHQQAQHREIEQRYRRRKRPRNNPKAYLRVRELDRIIDDRFGPGAVLPDDKAGQTFIFAMVNHLAHLDAPDGRITTWLARRAPWHDEDRTAALIDTVVPKPRKWRADSLGKFIGLDHATRTRLKITTLGGFDCGKTRRATLRRKLAAARERERRAKTGAVPHATSAAQTKPWKARGISRATYYRHLKNETDETVSCAAYALHIVLGTNRSHGAPPPPRGGSWARAAIDGPERIFTTAARGKNVLSVTTM